ncbi:MAG TPA: tyrosine decarboxylase MfnA [Methanomicrobia archaeon]|nr:tyrosine decarboxylase MfnA [Methanomicrobia archaeon]
MEERGMSREAVESLLQEKKLMDLSYERILSSMCTYPHEIAIYAHKLFLESNLGDSGLFPGTKEMEGKVVRMIGSLLHKEDAAGYISTGGTESNIQAIRAIRNRRRKAGVRDMNIVVPKTAHFSFEKIADLLNLEVRQASLDPQLKVDVHAVEQLIDRNTIALVGIAGTTEFGQIDPIEKLSALACDRDLFLLVDAAFGGFVIPFLEQQYEFDFALDGVSAITIDPHKMGLSTLGSGCLLFRDPSFLDELVVATPYLSTKQQYSLVGTRSGASTAATYAVLKCLGREGLREIVNECMRLTRVLVRGTKRLGIFPVIEPVMNVVTLHLPENDSERVTKALEERRWRISLTRSPRALRLVIMPHTDEETIQYFLDDLEAIL